MCVICTAERGSMPTILELLEMSENNPDGAGIAWHDGETLHRFRNVNNKKVLGFILSNWDDIENSTTLFHFRIATHGSISEKNCHPFRFRGGYAAHNGIASDFTRGRFDSDSRNLFYACEKSGNDTPMDSGAEGKTCELTASGDIRWHYGQQILRDGVSVSNTLWLPFESGWDEQEDYRAGWNDGNECGCEMMTNLDNYGSEQECMEEFNYSDSYGPEYSRGFRDGLADVYNIQGDIAPLSRPYNYSPITY